MSTTSFALGPGPFPVGTTVGAYSRNILIGEGGPIGTVVTTATTSAQLVTTFTGLAYDTEYWAAAQVSGTWRKVAFATPVDPALSLDLVAINARVSITETDIAANAVDIGEDRARLDTLEAEQDTQDTSIAALQAADTTTNANVTALQAAVKRGTGSPEGAVTASIGAVYQQSDAATGKSLWVKNTGTGNTGWRLKRSAIPVDIPLFGPESRAAEALTADVSATYAFQGSALSASTAFLLGGVFGIVTGCFFQVIWTPNNASCGIRLISADAGPTNITQIAELTGSASATPLNDGTFVLASTMQALFDTTGAQAVGGSSKTLGFQTKGSGAVAPLIYVVRVLLILEI